ncbi:helix-turn-helix domain-containing protein [Micromonospora antibiotica]|uniref:Helix-turn-helix transcriptional regulator n=1 Tax=Micromonospora antibiotica TaxID=2807623 RepID=A0ABS3V118_9ACTN|nr:helix-turn-helix transcriptional regulator [Micromonospora antibiotica]MBO4159305.1 helix-turn-helix transcriptional regulator [Micromonospora antibiotica]
MFAPDPTGMHAAVFAAVFAALYAAHQVADHWVQTQHQADCKGEPGWAGRLACAAHVATYTLTAAVALTTLALATGLRLDGWGVAVGLTVSAVSHYIADRRTPLRRLAVALGKDPHWLTRGGGMYALDQSWHIGFLFIAALFCAV